MRHVPHAYTQALGPKGRGRRLAARAGAVPRVAAQRVRARSEAASRVTCRESKPAPIASVLGEPRDHLARHTFLGGNFFMLRMLNRYRDVLGVAATAARARRGRARHASPAADGHRIGRPSTASQLAGGQLDCRASSSATGPATSCRPAIRRVASGCTSRSAIATGRAVFESGAVTARGPIVGNDNDADPTRVEPHYDEIRTPDQVQIYESVMADAAGAVDDGPAPGDAVREGQPPAAARLRQGDGRSDIAVRGIGEAGRRLRGERRHAFAMSCRLARRAVRSGSRWSCGISRSRSGGPTTCGSTQGRSRSVSCRSGTRWRPRHRRFSRALSRAWVNSRLIPGFTVLSQADGRTGLRWRRRPPAAP